MVVGVLLTIIKHVALTSPAFAVTVAIPAFTAVTTPPSTVATDSSEDVHSRISTALSGVTTAVNSTVSPTNI